MDRILPSFSKRTVHFCFQLLVINRPLGLLKFYQNKNDTTQNFQLSILSRRLQQLVESFYQCKFLMGFNKLWSHWMYIIFFILQESHEQCVQWIVRFIHSQHSPKRISFLYDCLAMAVETGLLPPRYVSFR